MSAPYPQYPASPPAAVQYVPRPPDAAPGAHPFLREPKLYISDLNPLVTDLDLAHAFEYCVPFRPTVVRDGSGQPISGQLRPKFASEFSTHALSQVMLNLSTQNALKKRWLL
jgi:hypothetical protein